ncbi:MAG: FKBP-type peptidyl-prolyl cis-trans isomerase [Thermodesulfobacteriota bacterium]
MILTLMAVLGVMFLAAPANAAEIKELKTGKDKISYGIGVGTAKNLKRQGIEVNTDAVVKGLQDELGGAKLLMTDAELQATMGQFQQELRQKLIDAKKKEAADNEKEGAAFLAQNKKEKGVVTRPSGLQYKIITAAKGKKPKETDTVEVNYKGTLINGTEFDSSYKRGQPATLKVKEIITGWREALTLMPVGSKWQLFVPPQLAYGERGAGGEIGPNATLIFEVELLAIK